MHRRRIFISHRNNDPQSDAYVDAIRAALHAADCDVLVDTDCLKPGDDWRDELYTLMGISHGALIVVSDAVMRGESSWVPREASILMWRRALDPTFDVIPICVGAVEPEKLDGAPFDDLRLQAVQGIRADDPATLAQAIVKRLAAPKPPPSPLDALADRIVKLLDGVGESAINDAADALDVDLGPWIPGAQPQRKLALALLQLPLGVSVEALRILADHLDRAQADEIIDIVAPSWVDLGAARWLADFGTRGASQPALIINASTHFAATMYVRRASCRPPRTQWPFVVATGVYGEDPAREIAAEIERNLIQALRLADDPLQPNVRGRLLSLLQNLQNQRRPVFVGLQFSPVIADVLADLQQEEALRNVTLILLSGVNFPEAAGLEIARVQFVVPKLEAGAEELAQSAVDVAKSLIRL
jgi:hypothetical protein